ncbi:MAG: patatin-like phospholipase family protein, partial [Rhodobacteraceae bacterium]|nr:patatin-like phospholipase family protein [Paracoccaceae bacterium]
MADPAPETFLQFLIHKVAAVWNWLRLVLWFVRATRFSLFTVLMCLILLVFSAQGKELAQLIGHQGLGQFSWLLFALVLFAVQAWYWARVTLRFADINETAEKYAKELDDTGLKEWISGVAEWLPRFYAMAAFSSVLLAMALTGFAGRFWAFLVILVVAVVVLVILKIRQSMMRWLVHGSSSDAPKDREHKGLRDLSHVTQMALYLSLAGSAVSLALVWTAPVWMGQLVGATAAAFFACAFIIPVGSFLTIWTRQSGIPVILSLLIWAGVASNWNDNHLVPPLNGGVSDQRPTLDAAIDRWLDKNPSDDGEAVPVVIVSTAGGGLRAAYWTTTVLGALQDQCVNFSNRTFAISGVSGGSVGAAVFAAHVTGHAPAADTGCENDGNQNAQDVTNTVLAQDFLGPTVAALLFPDLVQRFWPWTWFPSRGNVLADSWAAAWDKHCGEDQSCRGRLTAPFLDVAATEAAWRPALFLNATHQDSGKRFITSHVKIEQDRFFDAYDSHHVLGADVSLATAALNSARFTFVSPPGRLEDVDGSFQGRVLDGGYFENYGAVTATEILLGLMEKDLKRKVRPIFIQIASDPELIAADYPADAEPAGGTSKQTGFLDITKSRDIALYEIRGPAQGLLNTRTARGVLAAKSLSQVVGFIEENSAKYPNIVEPVFAHFEMCSGPDD